MLVGSSWLVLSLFWYVKYRLVRCVGSLVQQFVKGDLFFNTQLARPGAMSATGAAACFRTELTKRAVRALMFFASFHTFLIVKNAGWEVKVKNSKKMNKHKIPRSAASRIAVCYSCMPIVYLLYK
jgi:hypothetical protein